MASQDSDGISLRDAIAQYPAQLLQRFEVEQAKTLKKHNAQRIELLDEIHELRRKLIKSNESSHEARRLRDERVELVRENADLKRQLSLTCRQAKEFKETARRYKAKAEEAKEKYCRGKRSIAGWQNYADKHSPEKQIVEQAHSGRHSTVHSDAGLAAVVLPANAHDPTKDPVQTAVPVMKREQSGEHPEGCHITPSIQSPVPSHLPLSSQGGSNSQQSYVAVDHRISTKEASTLRLPGHQASEPAKSARVRRPLKPPQSRAPEASGGQNLTSPDFPPDDAAALPVLAGPHTADDKADHQAQTTSPGGAVIPSSQSTDEEISIEQDTDQKAHSKPIKTEPSPLSSSPIVASERQLKGKNKRPAQNEHRQSNVQAVRMSDGSAMKPFLIKEEQASISQGRAQIATLRHISSLDLDEVGDLVDTPRKRQRLQRLQHSKRLDGLSDRMASHLGYDRATSVPIAVERADTLAASRGSSQAAAWSFDGHDIAQREAAEGLKTHDVGNEDGGIEYPQQADSPLQPISLNRQNMPPVTRRYNSRRRFGRRDKALKSLIEDGESVSVKRSRPTATNEHTKAELTTVTSTRKTDGQRIETLLQKPPSQVKTLLATPVESGKLKRPAPGRVNLSVEISAADSAAAPPTFTPQLQVIPDRKYLRSPATEPQRSGRSIKSPTKGSSRLARVAIAHCPSKRQAYSRPVSPSPSHEPLSARPLHRLGLQDFKINPAFNNGLKYAYDDTVRRIAEKACLPGCTDQRCCGNQFRRIVELGLTPGVSNTSASTANPVQSLAGEDQADLERLEAYLGGGHFAVQEINRMDPTTRANAIVEAKASEIARKFGKHRQRNERRKTPDGFWDAEMPSTQKLEGHKEAVAKMEKETVEARYKEAKREDRKGRWLFRDE